MCSWEEPGPIMVKRWLAALSGSLKQFASSSDPNGDGVLRLAVEFERAIDLFDRYQRTGDLDALTEAVTSYRHALATTPTGHPSQAAVLNNLGIALRSLYWRTGELAALTEAVTIGREAVTATPTGHPKRAMYLTSLGTA